ncbi:glycoside hydrolase family 15 protein [Basidiobolus meristosporus CBS 931.73]|uniref:Glycoside hydrolase family 15 protein n=1 Tax=Basidiobolus meristosporus CBS 931.73 TaxID=1314790 RepID=A0A1Y1Y6E3_9FUNG|nr:glycoside hydrolase family 15 protein [Basidiobolus meristosporus CBS 931.73]|eukprot:ORX93558.1 glycoside hydrolase family 15 protein [Basidiobolus meristosporus CBS 931.73]
MEQKCRHQDGYLPVENYGVIGNMRTVALCSVDGSIDFFCYPNFDSPSVFARMLDKDRGGYFTVSPEEYRSSKQQYLPGSNILNTKFVSEDGVCELLEFMHHPKHSEFSKPLYPWLIRKVKMIRGNIKLHVKCHPAFNYGLDTHEVSIKDSEVVDDQNPYRRDEIHFDSQSLCLQLQSVYKSCEETPTGLEWSIEPGELGQGVFADFFLTEGEEITFVLSEIPKSAGGSSDIELHATPNLLDCLFNETLVYWNEWIAQCKYDGKWRETVQRSALMLKMLTYSPTGAIIAAPTFSLPQVLGGSSNWDYRYSWIRDSAFSLYALIRLGMTEESEAYMQFLEKILEGSEDGSIQPIYTIHGSTVLEEKILDHLDGYKSSRPVRIGNAAVHYLQLDIYGELLDAIYLYSKYSKPISFDMWNHVRKMINYVCQNWRRADSSIWESRGEDVNHVFSKIMCWVAIDRGIRLTEKHSWYPSPELKCWVDTRNEIYLEVMDKGWNEEKEFFGQSYERIDILDASVLMMPLVFFISPADPRLLKTLNAIRKTTDKAGLIENNLVYRFNCSSNEKIQDEESHSICTFWLVEALTRAGKYDTRLLYESMVIFEQTLSYSNHLDLFSEKIAKSGESLGNFPQAFTHMALISSAYNLDRVLSKK